MDQGDKYALVLMLMILAHLLADFAPALTGWLSNAKCKEAWSKTDKLYQDDWIPALVAHSMMWSVMIFLPIAFLTSAPLHYFWLMIPANCIIHTAIDHFKANMKLINLATDQSLHMIQILITWGFWMGFIVKGNL